MRKPKFHKPTLNRPHLSKKHKDVLYDKTLKAIFASGIVAWETELIMIDSMAAPTKRLRAKQESYIRNAYKRLNEMARMAGLKPKKYTRINSQGTWEIIE